jgi:hypothetical protein
VARSEEVNAPHSSLSCKHMPDSFAPCAVPCEVRVCVWYVNECVFVSGAFSGVRAGQGAGHHRHGGAARPPQPIMGQQHHATGALKCLLFWMRKSVDIHAWKQQGGTLSGRCPRLALARVDIRLPHAAPWRTCACHRVSSSPIIIIMMLGQRCGGQLALAEARGLEVLSQSGAPIRNFHKVRPVPVLSRGGAQGRKGGGAGAAAAVDEEDDDQDGGGVGAGQDLKMITSDARNVGLDLKLTGAAREQIEKGVKRGLIEWDIAAMVRVIDGGDGLVRRK